MFLLLAVVFGYHTFHEVEHADCRMSVCLGSM